MSIHGTTTGMRHQPETRSSLRILVVEDEPADARLTATALREQLIGCEAFVVPTCREALAFLDHEHDRDAPVDVVLLDIRLPDGDGLDLLQQLQDRGQLDHTRVVVFSGVRDGEHVIRAYELGASFYLVKPTDFADYQKVVDAITRCVASESYEAPASPHPEIDSRPTILLVEDSASDARLVIDLLKYGWTAGFDVRHVERLSDAQRALTDNVWAIILDLSLPDASGMTAIRELHGLAPFTSIVVLTGLADESAGLRALEHGAQDYLLKDGLTSETLSRSVQFAMQRTRALATVTHLATHDPLTDLPNRRLLLDRLQIALARAKRNGAHVAVLFVDLDDFKSVNDRFGHTAGDAVLKEAARRMQSAVRPSDTVCRLAGDEFVILCEEVPDERTGVFVTERVGRALAGAFEFEGVSIDVKASLGLAIASETLLEATELLRTADAVMYDAKRAAGARVTDGA